MKKFVALLVAVLMFVGVVPALAKSPDHVTVILNDTILSFDVPAQIIDNRTMVPLRGIFEELGATVTWDEVTYTATGEKDGVTVSIAIGDNKVVKTHEDGTVENIEIDVPAQIVGDRTLVPARAISESFDCQVNWDADAYTVTIITLNAGETIPQEKSAFRTFAAHLTEHGKQNKEMDHYITYTVEHEGHYLEYIWNYVPETDIIEFHIILHMTMDNGDHHTVTQVIEMTEEADTYQYSATYDGLRSYWSVSGTVWHEFDVLGAGTFDPTVLPKKFEFETFQFLVDGEEASSGFLKEIEGTQFIEKIRAAFENHVLGNYYSALEDFNKVLAKEGLGYTYKDFGFIPDEDLW